MTDTPATQIPSRRRHSSGSTTPGRTARRLTAVALVGAALTLAACSSGGSASPSTTAGGSSAPNSTTGTTAAKAAAPDTITIQNFSFSPTSMTVAPGATVTIANKDQVAHTVTAVDGKFDTGNIPPGQSKTITAPNTAGAYPYMCSIHQYMTGTLKVS